MAIVAQHAWQASPEPNLALKNGRGHLRLQAVNKRFSPSGQAVLQDINLNCQPGEFVVVVGPSGCGKTTLLNIVAGMTKPDTGRVELDGQPIEAPGPERAMVFQDHGLFPWLTAAQNIEFGLKMARVPTAERRNRVEVALRMVHLSGSADKLVHELSVGMRQRVAIARALVMDPAVLLMDEPFASVDAQTRTLLHEQLQEIWGQSHKTILFVTHSVGEAARLADRIIVLHAHPGRVRREFRVQLPHPRNFDSPDLSRLVQQVRREIEDEVNSISAAEHWKPSGAETGVEMGDGI